MILEKKGEASSKIQSCFSCSRGEGLVNSGRSVKKDFPNFMLFPLNRLPGLMSLWVLRSGWHKEQSGLGDVFPKCLLIEQALLSVPWQAAMGTRSTIEGLRVYSLLHRCRWWHCICYEASRCEILISTKAVPHKISKTQWGGDLMWYMGFSFGNPSHFPMHEAIKSTFYSLVMSFYSSR